VFSSNGTLFNQTHTGSVQIPSSNVTTCAPLRLRVIADASSNTNPQPCGPLTTGQIEDYTVKLMTPAPPPTISIAMTSGNNPSCLNAPLTSTASTNNANPIVHGCINGVYTGISASNYSSTAFVDGDIVTAYSIYTGACSQDSVLSNSILVQRVNFFAPTISIAQTQGTNPFCLGQTIEFSATVANAGPTPLIEWYKNNTLTATTGAVYSSTTVANGDIFHATVTGSGGCPDPTPAVSNSITMTAGPVPASVAINITSGTNPSCAGDPITFEAVPTFGGTAPAYVWTVNGTPVSNSSTFNSNTLNNGDVVQVKMLSNLPCAVPDLDSDDI